MKRTEIIGACLSIIGILCMATDVKLFGLAWTILSYIGSISCLIGFILILKSTLK